MKLKTNSAFMMNTSHDEKTLYLISRSVTAKSLETGKTIGRIFGVGKCQMALSNDDKYMALLNGHGMLHVYAVDGSYTPLFSVAVGYDDLYGPPAFTSDSRCILVGANDKVYMYRVDGGEKSIFYTLPQMHFCTGVSTYNDAILIQSTPRGHAEEPTQCLLFSGYMEQVPKVYHLGRGGMMGKAKLIAPDLLLECNVKGVYVYDLSINANISNPIKYIPAWIVQPAEISAEGRFVTFVMDETGYDPQLGFSRNVGLLDVKKETFTHTLDVANPGLPSISGQGNYWLVPGVPTSYVIPIDKVSGEVSVDD